MDRNQDGRVTANELQFMLKNLGIIVRDELIGDLIKEASHSGKCSAKAKKLQTLYTFFFWQNADKNRLF